MNIEVARPRFAPFPGLEPGVYPISMPPMHLAKCKFNGTEHIALHETATFDADLICIAKTAHGVQGQTCTRIVIASWPKKKGRDSSTW